MRLRVLGLVLLVTGAAAVWACSLNPQPLPPDTNDAGIDGMVAYGPEAGGGVDGANTSDDGATPSGDASIDAPSEDASSDGASDASDAEIADAGEDG